MTFVDQLRLARTSPVTAVHEFKLDYLPGSGRVYAFTEGHDDVTFYFHFLKGYVADLSLVRIYKCGNKQKVFDAHAVLASSQPQPERVLFFVDKDLADVLSEARPSDPRFFETEHYSIENYLVCREMFDRYVREFVRIKGVAFDLTVAVDRFEESLNQFYSAALPVMAWIAARRSQNERPNVANIHIAELIGITDTLDVRPRRRCDRVAYLCRVTGMTMRTGEGLLVRSYLKRLMTYRASEVVRGKFVAWFFLEFIRLLERQFRVVATEVGGSVTVRTVVHADNFVEVLAPRLPFPGRLREFLDAHLNPTQIPRPAA